MRSVPDAMQSSFRSLHQPTPPLSPRLQRPPQAPNSTVHVCAAAICLFTFEGRGAAARTHLHDTVQHRRLSMFFHMHNNATSFFLSFFCLIFLFFLPFPVISDSVSSCAGKSRLFSISARVKAALNAYTVSLSQNYNSINTP